MAIALAGTWQAFLVSEFGLLDPPHKIVAVPDAAHKAHLAEASRHRKLLRRTRILSESVKARLSLAQHWRTFCLTTACF
jgi:hypothetical protein